MKVLHDHLYTGAKVHVWVEDDVSKSVLELLWNDARIRLHVAGDARKASLAVDVTSEGAPAVVVAVLDRDFRTPKPDAWSDPGTKLLYLESHEVENLLLDFDALAAVSNRRREEVERVTREAAEGLLWWAACCASLATLRKGVPHLLPRPPAIGAVTTLGQAVDHVAAPDGLPAHQKALREIDRERITDVVRGHGRELNAELETDAWKKSFPGKQIMHHIRSRLPTLDTAGKSSPRERDLDLAKRLAREMGRSSVPDEAKRLRTALLHRAGL